MRYWKSSFILAALVAAPLHADIAGISSEYTTLQTPKDNLPIGAEWIPGYGPNGDGTPDNVTISKGFASSSIKSQTRNQIGASLGAVLGISLDINKIKNVELEGIEIHRVADLSKLPLKAGQQVIFEGIKAKRVTITVDKGADAGLSASTTVDGIAAVGKVDVGNSSKITLNGVDLFLAYQVASFNNPTTASKTLSHGGGKEVIFNDKYRFIFCMCHENGDVDVRFQNLSAPGPGGNFETILFTYPGKSTWVEYRSVSYTHL